MLAASIAVGDRPGLGTLRVRYLTKGGAYNLFQTGNAGRDIPESVRAATGNDPSAGYQQLTFGSSIDDLVLNHGLPEPTHIKIDVDWNEPAIIAGCQEVLKRPMVRSLLVEINKASPWISASSTF